MRNCNSSHQSSGDQSFAMDLATCIAIHEQEQIEGTLTGFRDDCLKSQGQWGDS
jgi:hypothetical protein